MATEKRLIEIIECLRNCANNTDCERCSRWQYPCDERCVDDLMASAAEELEKFVNAVEVVHGRWRFCGSDRYNDAYECSVCGKMAMDDSNYCPNCGAFMDGGFNNG